MAAFTKKKQALHDIMAGCLVLNKAKSSTWFDRAVKELIEIFRLHPESFVPGEGGHPEERIQIISRMLKERGGLRMMEKAYSRILRECELMEEKLLRQRIKNYLDSSGLMWDSQPITPETGNRSQEYLSDKS